jgi:hypothetical protein
MKRLLSAYSLMDVNESRTPQDIHRASLGVWLNWIQGENLLGQRGQRGVLITVPFGPQERMFKVELPRLLSVPPWDVVSAGLILRPSYDPTSRVRVLGLPGVAPEAVEAWKTLAPYAPSVWLDLFMPTCDDALLVMGHLAGVLDLRGSYDELGLNTRAMEVPARPV